MCFVDPCLFGGLVGVFLQMVPTPTQHELLPLSWAIAPMLADNLKTLLLYPTRIDREAMPKETYGGSYCWAEAPPSTPYLGQSCTHVTLFIKSSGINLRARGIRVFGLDGVRVAVVKKRETAAASGSPAVVKVLPLGAIPVAHGRRAGGNFRSLGNQWWPVHHHRSVEHQPSEEHP